MPPAVRDPRVPNRQTPTCKQQGKRNHTQELALNSHSQALGGPPGPPSCQADTLQEIGSALPGTWTGRANAPRRCFRRKPGASSWGSDGGTWTVLVHYFRTAPFLLPPPPTGVPASPGPTWRLSTPEGLGYHIRLKFQGMSCESGNLTSPETLASCQWKSKNKSPALCSSGAQTPR